MEAAKPRALRAHLTPYIVQRFDYAHLSSVQTGSPSKGCTVAGKRVLIVDDDRDSLVICEARLTAAGYLVASVNDGRRACESALAHQPDVILLDYRMPGISGEDVARGLDTDPRCSAIPVIILTADAGARYFEFSPNVCRVLLKPCESSDLIEAVTAAASGECPPE